MKIKKLITSFALASVMALGVGVGIAANRNEAKGAKANAGDYLADHQLVGDALGVGWTNGSNSTYQFVEQATEPVTYTWTGAINSTGRFRVIIPGSWTTKLNCNNIATGGDCGGIFVSAKSHFGSDDDNNIYCSTAGDYTITINAAKSTLSFAVAEAVEYQTVTKYAVLDGVKQGSTYGDPEEVVKGTTYAVPGRASWSGYHFVGWYTNEACTSAYVAAALNDDLTLYAKFTTLSKDSYIYYVTNSESATPNMIHTWGGDTEYAANNVSIVSITGVAEVHGVISFQGTSQLIYKIPVSSESGDTSFKFHYNNWASESSEMTLAAGSAYKWGPEVGYDEAAAGDALDFLIAAEAIRNAVTASGKIKAYSVCGISAGDAEDLCDDYNDLSAKARGYVDDSNTFTYNPENTSEEIAISYYDVMEQLAKIAGGVALNGHSAPKSLISLAVESNTSMIIIVVISATALIAVGGFFLLRKKREN